MEARTKQKDGKAYPLCDLLHTNETQDVLRGESTQKAGMDKIVAHWIGKNGIMCGEVIHGEQGYEVRTDTSHTIPIADLLTSKSFYMIDEQGRQVLEL